MRLLRLPGVFRPPSDAWMLAERLRQEPLRSGCNVLDLCTGSGILAISAALEGAAHVTAVDVSRRAVLAVRLNGWINGVRIEALRGDLFTPVTGRRFDLIVSNPPYLPGDPDQSSGARLARAWEGGPSGRAFIERIARGARAHLTADGVLLLVCSTVCGEAQTLGLLESGALKPAVVARHRGALGPLLRSRAQWLRQRGLLLAGDEEEILVIRAVPSTRAESASPCPGRRHSTSSPDPSPGLSAPARAAGS